MSLQIREKLKKLYDFLPEGAVVPSGWLQKKGYSRQLIFKYLKAGWLKSVGTGAYCRPTTKVGWKELVTSWQNVDLMSNHIGGETALNLQGHTHYPRLAGEKRIYLFGSRRIPTWVKRVPLKECFRLKSGYISDKAKNRIGLIKLPTQINGWNLTVSGPERAMLETIEEVRDEFSFIHVVELMESLTALRPQLVNQLLRLSHNIRVKRIFLFMANYCNHVWARKIDTKGLELGRGKRAVVQKGKLNKEFLITVPETLHDRSSQSIL